MNPAQRFIAALAFTAGVAALDQISKQIALALLAGAPPHEVFSFFHLALVFNRGAAFGFLDQAGGWQHYALSGIAVFVSVLLVAWMWRARVKEMLLLCALALLLGGALGNLIDRVTRQHVIDFIVLHYQNWYFPAFNFADIAITFGALGVFIESVMRPRRGL